MAVIEIDGDHVNVEIALFGRAHRVTLTQDELTPPDVSVAERTRRNITLNDPEISMEQVVDALLKRDYGSRVVEKVLGLNFRRAFGEIWAV